MKWGGTLCVFISVAFISCNECGKKLEGVNKHQAMIKPFDKENLDRCPSIQDGVSKVFLFSIEHESICNLDEFQMAIFVDYNCVYYGTFSKSTAVPLDICKSQHYELKLAIVDMKRNREYWWQNKRSYKLADFDRATCTLLEADHFDLSNGIEFDLDLGSNR